MGIFDSINKVYQELDSDQSSIPNILTNLERGRLFAEFILGLEQDRKLRKGFSNKLFILTCSWLLAVIVIIVFSGLKIFILNDGVLITLLTTTTINVIGLLYVIINNLFPSKTR